MGGVVKGILDCSRPEGDSVNSYTDGVTVKFSYNSMDDVAALMQRSDTLVMVDIRDAYRVVSIHPRCLPSVQHPSTRPGPARHILGLWGRPSVPVG